MYRYLLLACSVMAGCADSSKGTPGPVDGGAADEGWPFGPSSCAGATISQAQFQQLTANGTQDLPIGQSWVHSRSCSTADGCGPWSAPAAESTPADSVCSYSATDNSVILNPQAQYAIGSYVYFVQWQAELHVDTGKIDTVAGGTRDKVFNNLLSFDTMNVTFTDHCLRAYGHLAPEGAPSPWPEKEYVWLATF